MIVVDVTIATIWIAFWIYWLAAALNTKTTKRRSISSLPIRVALLLLVLSVLRTGVFKGRGGTVENPVLWGIGLALFLAGIAVAIWARRYLGRNWGTPMSEKAEPELVTSGPYRFVRHPIYAGILLATIGTTVAVSVFWLLAVAVMSGYFTYSAFVEERNMERLFPDAYPEYKRSTKMLVPFVF